MEILKGDKRYINSQNDDLFLNLELKRTSSLYKNENIIENVSDYDIFLNERNACNKYIFYGKMEILFDDVLNFNIDEWVLEIGYPTYEFNDNNNYTFSFMDIGLIRLANIDLNTNDIEYLLFVNEDEKIYTKFLDSYIESNFLYIKIDTLRDLRNYKLYINNTTFIKKFNKIGDCKVYKNSYGVNIYNDNIYQFIYETDVDISNYVGFINEPMNEIVFRLKDKIVANSNNGYLRLNAHYSLVDGNVISKANFNINSFDTNIVEHNKTTYWMEVDKNSKTAHIQSVINYYDSLLPTPIPRPLDKYGLHLKTNNYITYNIKEYGETLTDFYYNDLNLPDYIIIFNDGTYFYRDIMNHETTEHIKEVPFMNNRNYFYEDMKFFISLETPITEYDPLKLVENVERENNIINPNTNRLC